MAEQARRGGRGWRFWIDRGGTFTDVVGCDPEGRLRVRKVLSEQPERPSDPAVRAIQELLGLGDGPIPDGWVDEVRLGTTVATNALLEHHGAPVVLLINRGLADLLRIGDQHRPDIFALAIERPRPLDVRVIEVGGRLAADGRELEPLQLDGPLAIRLREAQAAGYRSCAVALLHSCRQSAHEQQLAAWLAPFGFEEIALSHQLSAQPRLVPRGHTTLVEAAVAPVLDAYLAQVCSALGPGPRLRVMCSSGVLAAPAQLHAKDTILSGPAGGMVGAVAVARLGLAAAGEPECPVVGFDMGGTSTDVFHFAPELGALAWERQPETEIAGLRLQAPMLPIHTVAAGGGSIVHFDGMRLQVGPESAGANPGPAAYGRGGPATITDANLLLGRLPAAALPPVFGPGGDQGADPQAARTRFAELAARMAGVVPGITPEQVASGSLAIAIETMAGAIRRISIERGHDLRGALLLGYGGAGGQHACRLAEVLGIPKVLLHPLAGVLSAYGIGMARQRLLLERSLAAPLSGTLVPTLRRCYQQLLDEGRARLGGDRPVHGSVRLELRYPGSERGLEVPWSGGSSCGEAGASAAEDPERQVVALQQAFAASHRRRFGYLPEPAGEPLIVERLLLDLESAPEDGPATGPPADSIPGSSPGRRAPAGSGSATSPLWHQGRWLEVPHWQRTELQPNVVLQGPALISDPTSTSLLEAGWQGRLLPGGALLLEQHAPLGRDADSAVAATAAANGNGPDPTLLQLYNHRFMAVAEQMGARLQQSARSVNIRERLDFSCAVFDRSGALVANAPHIPVHLGSMGDSVAALLAAIARGERAPLAPGDVVLSNDPYNGGTHLPDITAITPVFAPAAAGEPGSPQPVLFVACRGHHADVGGISPGSMPAFSRTIAEEGLLLDNQPFVQAGRFDEPAWRQRLAAGPWPVRNPDQLLSDLQAQVAANQLGVDQLQQLIARHGLAEVLAYAGHGQRNAAAAVRRALTRLSDGDFHLDLDGGGHIAVAIRVDQAAGRALVDFSGTSPQRPDNFNAPLAVTKAAVLYVFRCLVGEPIPLNAGCLEPLELVVPEGCLLNPCPPAAVVAGNVEVSQALTNALFAALGVQAAAQGTMNNLSFGNARCQYYETICGGTGAGRTPDGLGFAGAAAVQSHMTNSRLTDPEVLEARFPVRLERFAIRRGSGGAGRWPGGDGVVRQLRCLEPLAVSLISGSRSVAPFGLAGGSPGACGRNGLLRADGSRQELPGCCAIELQPGEALCIETPGGGGYGPVADATDPSLPFLPTADHSGKPTRARP
jgi:5-oxoprolinase (ATP-hydrolysing)